MRYRRNTSVIAACLAILGVVVAIGLVVIGSHIWGAEPAHLIVPTGFRGHIHVVHVREGGQPGSRFLVPPTGVLEVASFAPFERHELVKASSANGTPVAILLDMQRFGADVPQQEGWYWVGDPQDLWDLRETLGKRSRGRQWRKPGSVVSDDAGSEPDN